jgi:hypothetical protein
MISGRPSSIIATLETGRTSAVLDAQRLEAEADGATAAQVRDLIVGLIEARQWRPGDTGILLVFDAGYDLPRLAFLGRDTHLRTGSLRRRAAQKVRAVRRARSSACLRSVS